MAALDRAIFRERAIEKYTQRQELHVILRLVSPRMFVFLWALFLLFLGAAALAWTIQEPVNVAGQGVVIQQKVNKGQEIVLLLLLPAGQQANLRAGQPVSVSIDAMNVSFTSSIQRVEPAVLSPDTIRTQFNVPAPLAQIIAGPSAVALASVEPASQAETYLGSQCRAQIQVGSESALSLLPGFNDFFNTFNILLNDAEKVLPLPSFDNLLNQIDAHFKR